MRKYRYNNYLFSLFIALFLYMSNTQADGYADCNFTLASGTPVNIRWFHYKDNVQTSFGSAIRHGPEDNSKQRTWIEVQTKDQKNLFTLTQKDNNIHIWAITGEKIDGVSLAGASIVTCTKICTFAAPTLLTPKQLDTFSRYLTDVDFNPPSELEKVIKSCALL